MGGCCWELLGPILERISGPIEWFCELTIPHEPEAGKQTTRWLKAFTIGWKNGWYMVGFTVSLCYVALLSDLILITAKFCCDTIGMSENLEGVTVLAWGAQVPDCLASIAMAKKGLGPGAVANAIGSQIINVFIGLGVPFAIAGHASLHTDGVKAYMLCLMVCVSSFVGLSVAPMYTPLPWWLGGSAIGGGNLTNTPILTPKSAWVLCFIWLVCNIVIVLLEDGGDRDPCLIN